MIVIYKNVYVQGCVVDDNLEMNNIYSPLTCLNCQIKIDLLIDIELCFYIGLMERIIQITIPWTSIMLCCNTRSVTTSEQCTLLTIGHVTCRKWTLNSTSLIGELLPVWRSRDLKFCSCQWFFGMNCNWRNLFALLQLKTNGPLVK